MPGQHRGGPGTPPTEATGSPQHLAAAALRSLPVRRPRGKAGAGHHGSCHEPRQPSSDQEFGCAIRPDAWEVSCSKPNWPFPVAPLNQLTTPEIWGVQGLPQKLPSAWMWGRFVWTPGIMFLEATSRRALPPTDEPGLNFCPKGRPWQHHPPPTVAHQSKAAK